MNVCVQCGKEDIPVIPPPEKCPHEYEIELKAADELAKAMTRVRKARLWLCTEDDPCAHCDAEHALAAYEKARGIK